MKPFREAEQPHRHHRGGRESRVPVSPLVFLAAVLVVVAVVSTSGLRASSSAGHPSGPAPPEIDSHVPVVAREGDQLRPAVGFMPWYEDFLVVIEDHYWGFYGPDIVGSHVHADGTPYGTMYSISYWGDAGKHAPAVACDPRPSGIHCLAVWQQVIAGDDHNVNGILVGHSGVVGGEVEIGNHSPEWEGDAAVAATGWGTYIVVWTELVGSGEFARYAVKGRLLNGDASTNGLAFPIAATTIDEFSPDVACCAADGTWLAVWQEYDPVTQEDRIFGQRMDAGGNPVGGRFAISAGINPIEVNPSVAFDSNSQRYLVAWEQDYPAYESHYIRGRFVEADGTLGDFFPISHVNDLNYSPDVSPNPNAAEFLVTWEKEYSPLDLDIFGERIAWDGTSLDYGALCALAGSEQHPAGAAGAPDYLVVWEDPRNEATNGMDIYSSRFIMPSPTPTPTGTITPTATPTPTPTRTPTPTPYIDLTVAHVELTQAIQCKDNPHCADNSVPLISGKHTYVRVYVGVQGAPGVGGVTASVISDIGGERIPALPLNYEIAAWPVPLRSLVNHTLNFWLDPRSVSASGTLEVEVNPDHTVHETNYFNNTLTVPLQFVSTPPLVLVTIPVRVLRDNGTCVQVPWYMPMLLTRYAENVLPVGDIELVTPFGKVINWTDPIGPSKDDSWLDLLDVVDDLSKKAHSGLNGSHWYGMIPFDVTAPGNTIGGYGQRPGQATVGLVPRYHLLCDDGSDDQENYADIMVHELGHNFDRRHAPCGDPGNIDPGYPHPGGVIGDFGWDPNGAAGGRKVALPQGWIVPETSKDYMTYCQDEWTSAYTYRAILDYRGWQPADAGAVPPTWSGTGSVPDAGAPEALQPYLFASGSVDGSVVSLRPWSVLDRPAGFNDDPGQGEWSLVLRSAGGTELFTRSFDPTVSMVSSGGSSEESDRTSFYEILPWHPDTAVVEVREGASLQASRTVSAHPPTVTVTAPVAGEQWVAGETRIISWLASDGDGDDLVYDVFFSGDGGATWEIVSSRLSGTELEVPVDEFPATIGALVQVAASDGLLTSTAESGAFDIAPKAPRVVILAPSQGGAVPPDQPLRLSGVGYDMEDGRLEGEALTWESDVDGTLGHGSELMVPPLSPGVHTITLSAEDSDGQTGSDEVQVLCATCVPGDVDCNGVVEEDDLVTLAAHLFGGEAVNPEVIIDGEVGASDLAALIIMLD